MLRHLAIIADGNRRWAAAQGLPPEAGHVQGVVAIERAVEWAVERGVPFLTVFAFSTENWERSPEEVESLFRIAGKYFSERKQWYVDHRVRVRFRGRRDRLRADVLDAMQDLEAAASAGTALTLTVCVDYGGRDEITRAVAFGALTERQITEALTAELPEPDMILRTGGRRRISNFLLWQAAYAELYFTDILFPSLEGRDLDEAAAWYARQVRTFGR